MSIPVQDTAIEDIYRLDGREYILDFEQNGMVYLREIVDGVAYLPGEKMPAVDFWEYAVQAEEVAS